MIDASDWKKRISVEVHYNIVGTFSDAIEAQCNCPNQINVTRNVRHQLNPHLYTVAMYFSY